MASLVPPTCLFPDLCGSWPYLRAWWSSDSRERKTVTLTVARQDSKQIGEQSYYRRCLVDGVALVMQDSNHIPDMGVEQFPSCHQTTAARQGYIPRNDANSLLHSLLD